MSHCFGERYSRSEESPRFSRATRARFPCICRFDGAVPFAPYADRFREFFFAKRLATTARAALVFSDYDLGSRAAYRTAL